MTEIERIKRYIKRTGKKYTDTSPYHINIEEAFSLTDLSKGGKPVDAVTLAFEYGRAKGYRAARAEQRKAVKA